MRKDVKILIGLSDRRFLKAVVQILGRVYTVQSGFRIRDFAKKVHSFTPDLVIIDYQFSGMKATDLYQGIEFMHPNCVFVVRAESERLKIARLLWKRRAMDYIRKSPRVFDFVQDVNKVVRYIIERKENEEHILQIKALKKSISELKMKLRKATS